MKNESDCLVTELTPAKARTEKKKKTRNDEHAKAFSYIMPETTRHTILRMTMKTWYCIMPTRLAQIDELIL